LGEGVVAYVIESGVAGPVVLVVGGIHGNEPAGSVAAEQVRQWPLARGRMVVVPRANVRALERGRRGTPGAGEGQGDLNRNFPRAGRDEGARGKLARVLWELAEEVRPDWLLDLHEGRAMRSAGGGSVGNTIISLREDKCIEVAGLMVEAVNVELEGKEAFQVLRGPVDGSLARGVGEHLGARSMILETTWRGQPLAHRARQHRVMVLALLRELGMVGEGVHAELGGEIGAGGRCGAGGGDEGELGELALAREGR
jgi:predicted deacylase